jgi:segregation and condensation protein A
MSYTVSIKNFEGPFALLVYLVEQAEMDIYDIEISKITADYLEYIESMEEENAYLAPEFLVLAATLMEIKSYMLLPHGEALDPSVPDPKTELQRKLVEYKRFRELSQIFAEKEAAGFLVRPKPKEDYYEIFGERDELLNLPLDKFIASFLLFLDRKKILAEMEENYARLERERESQEDKISFIASLFSKLKKGRLSFEETLRDEKDSGEKILSFVSLLEMYKENVIDLEQKELFGEIFIDAVQDPAPVDGKEEGETEVAASA